MKKIAILAIILVSLLVLISGCGSKQCESKSDCATQGKCKVASCVKNECKYTTISGCTCGDDECKDKENACGCPEDCNTIKPCDGEVGQYLEYKCSNESIVNERKCVTSLKKGYPKQLKPTGRIEVTQMGKIVLKLASKYMYDDPFNTEKSTFFMSLQIGEIDPSVKEVEITKIKVISHTGTIDQYSQKWSSDDEVKTYVDKDFEEMCEGELNETATEQYHHFEDELLRSEYLLSRLKALLLVEEEAKTKNE